MLTITRLSGDWQTDRTDFNRFAYYLRDRDHLAFGWAWAVEANPGDTGYHAHAWVWGDHLAARLRVRVPQVGFGDHDLRPVTSQRDFSYPIKVALHTRASLAEHRRLNGREIIHARNFWRDADTGESLTKEQALARSDPWSRHHRVPRQAGTLRARAGS